MGTHAFTEFFLQAASSEEKGNDDGTCFLDSYLNNIGPEQIDSSGVYTKTMPCSKCQQINKPISFRLMRKKQQNEKMPRGVICPILNDEVEG